MSISRVRDELSRLQPGMRQKLIIRARRPHAGVSVVDEPMVGLDQKGRGFKDCSANT